MAALSFIRNNLVAWPQTTCKKQIWLKVSLSHSPGLQLLMLRNLNFLAAIWKPSSQSCHFTRKTIPDDRRIWLRMEATSWIIILPTYWYISAHFNTQFDIDKNKAICRREKVGGNNSSRGRRRVICRCPPGHAGYASVWYVFQIFT